MCGSVFVPCLVDRPSQLEFLQGEVKANSRQSEFKIGHLELLEKSRSP